MAMVLPRALLMVAGIGTAVALIGIGHPASAEGRPMLHAVRAADSDAPPTNKYGELCASCHQQAGEGIENVFPPLAGSDWVTGRAIVPIAIVLHGLEGEIEVRRKKYNGAMMAWGGVLNDEDLAATLTYTRSQWGNRATPITAAQVKVVRAKLASRTKPFTVAELRALR
ncbi:MAG: cytochrome c [Gemmatimonadaceae bacterium]|nr:cytochrome c [Gemmatimonadaceae bacterium]